MKNTAFYKSYLTDTEFIRNATSAFVAKIYKENKSKGNIKLKKRMKYCTCGFDSMKIFFDTKMHFLNLTIEIRTWMEIEPKWQIKCFILSYYKEKHFLKI